MKNTFGTSVSLTVYGESHGAGIGAVIDGLAPGIAVDEAFIASQLEKRKPKGRISTSRKEGDEVSVVSGVFNGRTTGTPICLMIANSNTRSSDYDKLKYLPRPGHADYTAECKYHGFQDYRGGGHFSGRITAGIVAAGAIAITALKNKGITIGTHIKKCGGISDRGFENTAADIEYINNVDFAVLDPNCEEKMKKVIVLKEAVM